MRASLLSATLLAAATAGCSPPPPADPPDAVEIDPPPAASSSTSSYEEPDPKDKPNKAQANLEKAEAAFMEGRRLMGEGDFSSACKKFEESLRYNAALGSRLNLAACYEKLGDKQRACKHWIAAIGAGPDDARKRFASERARAIGCAP